MKIITTICCLLCMSIVLKAQPPRRDSTRRDSILFNWGETRAQLINAPVLRGNNEGTRILPNRQQFCFDMTMNVELFFGGRVSRQTCLFINTTDGYIGYTQPSTSGPIDILMPEVESFHFTVISFKLGNTYMYHNQKGKNGTIEHYVSTSNTEVHEYQPMNLLTAAPLNRKSERGTYLDGTVQATAYKRDDGPTLWFVAGDHYPATLQVQKILGLYGIGVVRTDAGVFIITEMRSGGNYTVIKRIERTHVCFDPTGFKMMEATLYTKRAQDLRDEADKITRDEVTVQNSGVCVGPKMELINFRKEKLRKKEDDLRKSQQGNLWQDRTAQKAMIDMMDQLETVQGGILATKISICGAEEGMSKHPDQAASYQNKIACLNQQLSALTLAETEMRAAERTYASNPAVANAQKSKIYYDKIIRNGVKCE